MLSAVSLSVPARNAGAVLVNANVFGIEASVQGTDNGNVLVDLEGKTDKIDYILGRTPSYEVLDRIESVPGEYEGYGLASDLVNGRNVYADLVGKPVYKV